jgi:predicted RNase H-like nuclease (RuvC/YqgF family)
MSDESEFIIGFDILPSHSPKSKTAPKFACAIIKDGVVLNEYPEISRGALLRLVKEVEPKWFCTDNIFEIVPDSKSLFHLAERIPPTTRIVQVTGVPPRQIPLKTLARRHRINVKGKPSPLESAKIAAQLVNLGVGYSVECFSEQTEIKVTRGRKMGKGGQSANRYRRKLHSEIQQMTRHIESELKLAEIDFDIDIRHSDFGYASSRIVAYAPLPVIQRIVERKRGGDFNVLISPVRKRTEFLPLEPQPVPTQTAPKYFILGIDPGTTAAICLLTLSGSIHTLISRKGLTRADIIRTVYERGIPVLVASDVPQTPHFVEKIARSINAEVYTPDRPISVADKQELAREYSEDTRIRNAHERDALTAAVYAFRSIRPKMDQIDKKIREEQISINRNQVKALVIKGMPMAEAIAEITREDSEHIEPIPEQPVIEEPLTQERYDALMKKYEDLQEDYDTLSKKLEDAQRMIEYLNFREDELSQSLEIINRQNYWQVKRDREVRKKSSEIATAKREDSKLRKQVRQLEERLERLVGVKRLEMRGDTLAIKTIPQFTRESIDEYCRKVGIRSGDIVLFEDASGAGPQTANLLIEKEIRAVIVDTPLSHLSKEALVDAVIPVIEASSVELQRIDEFAFISRKKFEKQFQDFMADTKEKARQRSEDQLVDIVEEYRADSKN